MIAIYIYYHEYPPIYDFACTYFCIIHSYKKLHFIDEQTLDVSFTHYPTAQIHAYTLMFTPSNRLSRSCCKLQSA
ncbi:hypothetical protein L2E82_10409 [Cichorium intybus]|uniref:Uncharacterized protein n=1 Tax=Cichorium intybus TaxID=13427 RepID=A0ACB9GAB9_CICIN|nr:hypothetical protein L2E82_10409 [Cichorium intybus]